jgi:hypothetical protein
VIVYAETSAVLRWLFNEAGGEEIFDRLRGAAKVVCSRLTLIETRRSVQRAVATAGILAAEAADLRATLAQAAARWALLELSADVAARAEQGFPAEPVRTLDAIHLASALCLRESLPDLAVVSTDERVRRNSALLGFDVLPADTG